MTTTSRILLALSFLTASAAQAATGYHCDFIRTNAQGQEVRRAAGGFVFKNQGYLSLDVPRNAAILQLSPDGHTFSITIGSTVSSRDRQFSTTIPAASFDRLPDALNYNVEAFTETEVVGAQPFQLNLSCKKF